MSIWSENDFSPLDNALNDALLSLKDHPITSEEYEKTMDRVSRLHKMKQDVKPATVSPDTLVVAATNLLGILLILRHERVDIITSKALGFVTKSR